ncbi:hypothetical protein [Haloarcula sp. JP-L23]|uniref:hypothetical protein n=1 Tax=Haloarcula sp. JP-L23 TaxID=2716717 RepID=UPI00140F3060|nr:hypothetical protein G9465_16470 [Haloarcula sp. JP-L23]
MNRRQFLAASGGAVASLGGYLGLRVADIRPYDPDPPSGETPRERIVAAARHRYAADHRALTRVRITEDSAGSAGYDAAWYRESHQHSQRRHTHVFTTRQRPPGRVPTPFYGLLGVFHWGVVDTDDLPHTSIVHFTDGSVLASWDAPTLTTPTERPNLASDAIRGATRGAESGMGGEWIRPHRTSWTSGDGDRAFVVTDRDGYAQVVTLPFGAGNLAPDCRVEVTLDDAGRLARIVDDRVLVLRPSGDDPERVADRPRTVGYRIVTEFDEYGAATAPRPRGEAETTVRARLSSLLTDVRQY